MLREYKNLKVGDFKSCFGETFFILLTTGDSLRDSSTFNKTSLCMCLLLL